MPRRMFLHKTSQVLHILDGCFRQDAMAKVEDVAGPLTRTAQDIFRARLQFLPAGKEQHRIQVALHPTSMLQAAPALVQRDAPVETDYFGSRLFHRGQKSRAIGSEINDRHACLLQSLHHAGDMRQYVPAVIFDAQAPPPTVKKLDYISPGAGSLGGGIHPGAYPTLAS